MSPKIIVTIASLALIAAGCGTAESHDMRLTHPPMVFGEYTTQSTHTADFAGIEVESSIPGRRSNYDSRTQTDNVVFKNSRQTVSVTVSNPTVQDLIAPQKVIVTFYDGPTGHEIETLSLTTDVVGAGETSTGSVTTTHHAESGTYYWAYHIEHADGWEVALEEYATAQEAAADEGGDDDDEWGDEDEEEDW